MEWHNTRRSPAHLLLSTKAQLVLFALGACVICRHFFRFVVSNAVNVPFWDEWDVGSLLIGNASLKELLLSQHDEHRIGVGLLLMKGLARLTNWSQTVEIYVTATLIFAAAAGLVLLRYKTAGRISVLDLVIPLTVLNILQMENLIWGFQLMFILPLWFAVLWLLVVNLCPGNLRTRRNVALTVLSLLSAYSSLHGLLLPFITALFLVFEHREEKQATPQWIAFTAANTLIIASYFVGFARDFQVSPASRLSANMVVYFMAAISKGFFALGAGIFSPGPATTPLAFVLVLATLLAGTIGVAGLRSSDRRNALTGTFLVGYGVMFALLITLGRSSFGANQALSSRYVSYTMLVPVGLFFVFSDLRYGSYFKTAMLGYLLFSTVAQDRSIWSAADYVTEHKKMVLECYVHAEANGSRTCFELFQLYPSQSRLDSLIPAVFRYKKLI